MNRFSLGKIITKRVLGRLLLGGLLLFAAIFSIHRILKKHPSPPDVSAKAVDLDMPDYNWRVCEDLGVGEVPGVNDPRQRFRLCHNQGWVILAYCLQPHLPAPPIDTVCENTRDSTYWCGDSYQLLSEYDIAQTPTPTNTPSQTPTTTDTPTATNTPVPTGTNTPSPTPSPISEELPHEPTVTVRPGPGGTGNLGKVSFYLLGGTALLGLALKALPPISKLVTAKGKPYFSQPISRSAPKQTSFFKNQIFQRLLLYFFLMLASGTLGFWTAKRIISFPTNIPPPPKVSVTVIRTDASGENPATNRPAGDPTPTPTKTIPRTELPVAPGVIDAGLDFSPGGGQISVQIDPSNSRVNRGKLIQLSFLPGDHCIFGDDHACVTPYGDGSNNHIFLTIHSGVGGEGQSFRHALEGTGINRAGFPLTKVDQNIKSLQGAEVSILQNGDETGGFELVGLVRIPPEFLEAYLKLPLGDAVPFASSLNPGKMKAVDLDRPMLIFETCGWKMPFEPWPPGITSTTGSIYLGVIQRRP